MWSAVPPKPRLISSKSTFTVVASCYNEQFTDALVDNCVAELEELSPQTRVDIIRVPGAFEIPVTIEKILNSASKPSIIIALGLIIRGETAHADLVADCVTKELSGISVRHQTPIIHEVLLVEDEKQAYARCVASNLNRGREAGAAAANMSDLFSQIDKSTEK